MKTDRHALQQEHFAISKLINTLRETNFNRPSNNTGNSTLTPKTLKLQDTPTSRLLTEKNLNELFSCSKQKSISNKRETVTPNKQVQKKSKYLHIQFLKPYNEYDKMLTGMCYVYNECAQNNSDSKLSADLTRKFKKDYVIGKVIGEGPYAEVRVAYHRGSGKKVAIKIYEKAKLAQLGRKKTVKRQIKILQVISHPNIVRLIDVAETNHHLSLIMEYLPGISLATALKQRKSHIFPQAQCRLIIKKVAKALMYLHSLLIAHRDIKLQNIILDESSQPKLIDFGFSTCIKEGVKINIFCGTPSYMSPEIIQRQEYRGQNADIWALGVIMFIMLVGYFPFQGLSDSQLYSKIIKGEYINKNIRQMRGAHDLIAKIFTLNPEKRITAPEILQHPWIKNQRKGERQDNKCESNRRMQDACANKSCPKLSYRESYSQKRKWFENNRIKGLSSTQADMNRSCQLTKHNNKKDTILESQNRGIVKQQQRMRRQSLERDKNMKALHFLKVQFQKSDKQNTLSHTHRL